MPRWRSISRAMPALSSTPRRRSQRSPSPTRHKSRRTRQPNPARSYEFAGFCASGGLLILSAGVGLPSGTAAPLETAKAFERLASYRRQTLGWQHKRASIVGTSATIAVHVDADDIPAASDLL